MNREEFLKNCPKKEDSPHYCIFEQKICPYAKKEGNVFNCVAPSDDAMLCRK